jgi:hypothetical protein
MSEQVPNIVSGAPAAPAAPPAAQPPAAAEPDYKAQAAQLQKERDEAIAKAKEHEQAAQYWHGKVKGGGEDKKPAEPEDDTDLLEVTAKGPKAMKDWLAKNGFVSKSEVDAMVQDKASQLTREAQLLKSHPELSDPDSDFFKATAVEYGQLRDQGVPEGVAMELAAERVGAKTKRQAAAEDPKSKKDGDADRAARARAQAPEGHKARPAATEDDDELTPEQKRIAEHMGISEEAYLKRAKTGVQYAKAS